MIFSILVYHSSSTSSSAHYSSLLDIRLFNFSPPRSIFGYSHPASASHPAQIVTPPGLRASYTTFTETRPPLQNSFTPAVIGSTADMASPLPLQRANTVCYVGASSFLPDHLVSDFVYHSSSPYSLFLFSRHPSHSPSFLRYPY
jgi:hypothetical protein